MAQNYLIPMGKAKARLARKNEAQRNRYMRLSPKRLAELAERAVEAGLLKRVTEEEDGPELPTE